MTKPVIAIDIDDVLADSASEFIAYSNKRWGTSLTIDEYHEHWAVLWNIEHDMAEAERRRDEYVASGIHGRMHRFDRAHNILQGLSRRYELHIVTSRQTVTKDHTIDWLNKHYTGIFVTENIHFAGMWDILTHESFKKTKTDLVKKIKADYLIDDQLKHCISAASEGVEVLLFGDYKWNQLDNLPPNITRVLDWDGVGAYFAGR